jgi:hypothetical protein
MALLQQLVPLPPHPLLLLVLRLPLLPAKTSGRHEIHSAVLVSPDIILENTNENVIIYRNMVWVSELSLSSGAQTVSMMLGSPTDIRGWSHILQLVIMLGLQPSALQEWPSGQHLFSNDHNDFRIKTARSWLRHRVTSNLFGRMPNEQHRL